MGSLHVSQNKSVVFLIQIFVRQILELDLIHRMKKLILRHFFSS